jgi:hypothetical protein
MSLVRFREQKMDADNHVPNSPLELELRNIRVSRRQTLFPVHQPDTVNVHDRYQKAFETEAVHHSRL